MCWNPTVSLFTYLFSITPIAILTFYYKKIPILLFLGMHSWISMQLIEFFLWRNLNDAKLNRLFSIVGFIAILSQPLFFMLSIPDFSYKYIIIAIYLFSAYNYIFSNKIEFKTVVAKNRHLEWKWANVPLINALMWIFFFLFRSMYLYTKDPVKYKKELFYFILIITGFIISYTTYLESKTWGSMWCWMANITSIKFYWDLYNIWL